MVGRIASLATVMLFLLAVRMSAPLTNPQGEVHSAILAVGFLLVAAVVAGQIVGDIGLPRITGYIVVGFLVGPGVLGLVTGEDITRLKLIDSIAVSLIALTAGGEIRLSDLKERGRKMAGIMVAEMVLVFVAVAGTAVLLASHLPFTAGREMTPVLIIAFVLGSIAIANSPSVAIAVINDTRSKGPVSTTILGVTVLKDVVVILLFAAALAVARAVLAEEGGLDMGFLGTVGWEVGGSIVVGAISGWIISMYLRYVKERMVLFALAAAFLNAYVAELLHLEVLVLSLTAGFFVENISPVRGEPFVHALEVNSLPLYALFFSLAGAGLHVDELGGIWPFVLLFVGVRAAAVYAGTWIGARATGAEPAVRRYAWTGFISQAGVTLGMVVITARAFPEWGAELTTLFVSMVAIHELVGPVLLQWGLRRAGETGQRSGGGGAAGRAGQDAPAPAGAAPGG